MKHEKLHWTVPARPGARVLCDVATGAVVGRVELGSVVGWAASCFVGSPVELSTVGAYRAAANAKRAVEARVYKHNAEVTIIDEPEDVLEIYEVALRNIMASGNRIDAVAIARDVLANPAGWLEEHQDRKDAEECQEKNLL